MNNVVLQQNSAPPPHTHGVSPSVICAAHERVQLPEVRYTQHVQRGPSHAVLRWPTLTHGATSALAYHPLPHANIRMPVGPCASSRSLGPAWQLDIGANTMLEIWRWMALTTRLHAGE